MPQSTVLPPPKIDFDFDFLYPQAALGLQPPAALFVGNSQRRPIDSQNNAIPDGPVATFTGGGSVAPRAINFGGRIGAEVRSTVNTQSAGWRPSMWMPAFDDTEFNPGAKLDPASVVGIFDWNVAATSALFAAGSADITGIWYQTKFAGEFAFAEGTPPSGNPAGGFGVALNDDGAGNNRWEFISYTGAGVVLARIPIALADVTIWNQFRFEIISAASGRPATLSLFANSTPIVDAQEFDDVVLLKPATAKATALGFKFGQCLGPMGGEGLIFTLYGRFGRYTSAGVELQGV